LQLDWHGHATIYLVDDEGRNNPFGSDRHAVLAQRVFDGPRWHADAPVLIRGKRTVALHPGVDDAELITNYVRHVFPKAH
jgi:hypothetical protein